MVVVEIVGTFLLAVALPEAEVVGAEVVELVETYISKLIFYRTRATLASISVG